MPRNHLLSAVLLALAALPCRALDFSRDSVISVGWHYPSPVHLRNPSGNDVTVDSVTVKVLRISGPLAREVGFNIISTGHEQSGAFHLDSVARDSLVSTERFSHVSRFTIPAGDSLLFHEILYGDCMFCLSKTASPPPGFAVRITFHSTAQKTRASIIAIGMSTNAVAPSAQPRMRPRAGKQFRMDGRSLIRR